MPLISDARALITLSKVNDISRQLHARRTREKERERARNNRSPNKKVSVRVARCGDKGTYVCVCARAKRAATLSKGGRLRRRGNFISRRRRPLRRRRTISPAPPPPPPLLGVMARGDVSRFITFFLSPSLALALARRGEARRV